MSRNTSTIHVDIMRRSFFASFSAADLTLVGFDEMPEEEQQAWNAAFACAYRFGFLACKCQALEKLEGMCKGGAA